MTQLQMLYGHVIANLFAVLILLLCWRWKIFGRFSLVLLICLNCGAEMTSE
jgi:hypothetical protein